jgi:hypothetical protein
VKNEAGKEEDVWLEGNINHFLTLPEHIANNSSLHLFRNIWGEKTGIIKLR